MAKFFIALALALALFSTMANAATATLPNGQTVNVTTSNVGAVTAQVAQDTSLSPAQKAAAIQAISQAANQVSADTTAQQAQAVNAEQQQVAQMVAGMPASIDNLLRMFVNPGVMYSRAFAKAQTLGDPAKSTWAALTFLAFAWLGLRMALEGSPHKAMSSLLETMLRAGIVFFMLDQYQMLVTSITDSTTYLVTVISGSGDQNGALSAASSFYQSARALWDGITVITYNPLIWVADVLYFIAGLILLGAALIYVLMYFIGDLVASLAISLGPIFIAMAVLEATVGFFDNWVKTLLTGLGYKVVAAGIVFLTSDMLTTALTTNMGTAASMGNAIGALILALATVYIMLQVPQLAASLFGAAFRIGSDLASSGVTGPGRDAAKGAKDAAMKKAGNLVDKIRQAVKGG